MTSKFKNIVTHFRFLSMLSVVSVVFLFQGCRKFTNFDTIIELVLPDECKNGECDLYLLDAEYDDLDNSFYSQNYYGKAENDEDGEAIIIIDWSKWGDIINPKKPINYYLVKFNNDYSSIKDAEFFVESSLQKIKASKIYYWEPDKDIFEYTGRRTDNKNSSGGNCSSIKRTWKGISLNGNSLPWKEYDDGSSSLTWTSLTLKFSGDTWTTTAVSKQVINGAAPQTVTKGEEGTYTCNGNSIEMTNSTSGASWTATLSNGELKMSPAASNYTYVYK